MSVNTQLNTNIKLHSKVQKKILAGIKFKRNKIQAVLRFIALLLKLITRYTLSQMRSTNSCL